MAIYALVALLLSCAPSSKPRLPPSSPFTDQTSVTHGVAAGDVTSNSALVWFRTAGPVVAQVEWRADSDFVAGPPPGSNSSEFGRSALLTTTKERDFTATAALHGLKPDTLYRYRVLTANVGPKTDFHRIADEVAAGRFTTAPSHDASQPTRFLWSGDLGGQHRCRQGQAGYAIFDRMLHTRPEFAVLLGDLIYGDERCASPPNAPGSGFRATTLEQFRAKHRYQRGAPALTRFLASVPVYAIWDDHEVRNNFSGSHDPLMPVGRQALLEYWPIRTPPEEPHRLYRKVKRGADLELFILDTRQYRSRNAEPDGVSKTMLGAAQRDWLLDGLRRSTALWKVIATSVPLSTPKAGTRLVPGNDSWARAADGTGFHAELRAIVNVILAHRIRNVVWLAADVHFAQVNAYDPDLDGVVDFHEFIAGPLSAYYGTPVPPDSALGPTTLYSGGGFFNFGVMTVDRTALRVEIIDETGTTRVVHTVAAQGRT
ncbi:MAG: alkaline phosphatase D family protein [Nitrospiraceae bacterium]